MVSLSEIYIYARGMSTRDIHDQLQELYGIELSAEMVSKITDKILPEVKEWQSRPLNPVYPFVFMDCIHYKVREDGRILSRAAYIVLGVTVEGYKEILSITVGANETSKFWLGMLNDPEKPWCAGCSVFLRGRSPPDSKTQSRPFSPRHRSSAV